MLLVSKQSIFKKFRIAILLAALSLTTLVFISNLQHLNNTAYAFTISLGHGYGKVFKTYRYYELPDELRESVDVHENAHLMSGTFRLWNRAQQEINAYSVQIAALDLKIESMLGTKLTCRETHVLSNLIEFRREMISIRETYKQEVR